MKLIVRVVFRLILFSLCLLLSFACSYEKDPSEITGGKFCWDFDSLKVYKYSYEQRNKFFSNSGGRNIDTTEHFFFGEIEILSKGEGKADFRLSVSEEVKHLQVRGKEYVCPDMYCNGNFDSVNNCIEFMGSASLMFPLPSRDIKLGEKDVKELKFPFHRLRVPGNVLGHNEIEYVRDIEPNLSLLRCRFKADSLDMKGKAKERYSIKNEGKAEYIFNHVDGYFLSSKIDYTHISKSTYYFGEKIVDISGNISYMEIKFLGVE